MLASVLAGLIIKKLGSGRVFVLGGWIYVVSLGLAAVATRPWQIAVAACLFVSVPVVSVWEAYTAVFVPDRLIGRVGAVSNFAAQSLVWIGILLVGFLADQFGAPAAVLCFTALLIPPAVGGHFARSLTLLETPLEQVEEYR